MKRSFGIALSFFLLFSILTASLGFASDGSAFTFSDTTPVPAADGLSQSAASANVNDATLQTRYGKTNKPGVNVRSSTSKTSKTIAQINNSGTPLIILDEIVLSETEIWYEVDVMVGKEQKTGFVLASLIDEVSEDDYNLTASPTPAPTAKGSSSSGSSSSGGSGGSGSMVWIPTRAVKNIIRTKVAAA